MKIERIHSSIIVQQAPQTKKIEDQGHVYFEIYTINGLARSISSPELIGQREDTEKKDPFEQTEESLARFITTKILYTISKTPNSHILLGEDIRTHKKIVIKLLSQSQNRTQNTQIQNEIEILSQIKHKNIIEYYGNRKFLNTISIYLEYFSGVELFYILQKRDKRPLSTGVALCIFKEIAETVSYLHSNRICHLDIKPENILINRKNKIKLIDFGMAQKALKNGLVEAYGGSMNYASPEAMEGGVYNGFLADTWSCGIVLYIMATGHFPTTYPIKIPQHTPDKIRNLLKCLLAISPEKRVPIQRMKWE